MTKDQSERYSRHITIKDIGEEGQERLLDSKVLVIGTGGLGSPAAVYLAAAGIGTLGLVDYDSVELSNLQRQIMHRTGNIGKPKVLSGMETINNLNPDVEVITYKEMVQPDNIVDIIKDRNYDFVIEATDNPAAKFLINDTCVFLKKPFSHGGIIRFNGQAMTYIPGAPCYRCIFKNPPPEELVPDLKKAGVLGAVCGIIGSIQAAEAIKYILGIGDLLTGQLLTYDALSMEFRKVRFISDINCKACGKSPLIK